MPLVPFDGKSPKCGTDVFIAPNAYVIGDVEIGDQVTILFGAVLRGDIQPIRIGSGSNIQENAVFHTSRGLGPCELGEEVTIGHGAILHGCTVCDRALVGMNATVLDSAVIEEDAIVAAQALVPVQFRVPRGQVAAGVPAKIRKEVSERDREFTVSGVEHYRKLGRRYAEIFGK